MALEITSELNSTSIASDLLPEGRQPFEITGDEHGKLEVVSATLSRVSLESVPGKSRHFNLTWSGVRYHEHFIFSSREMVGRRSFKGTSLIIATKYHRCLLSLQVHYV